MTVNRHSVRWCVLLVFVVSLLVASNNTAQASHKDDEIIVCTAPDNCFPQGDSSDDPSGADASSIVSYGSGTPKPPSLPPETHQAPGPPSSGQNHNPQVVTNTAPQAPAIVTTKTPIAAPPPKPYCSNHPEFGQGPLPKGWVKDPDEGSCSYDVCLNRPGVQASPPDGMYQDPDGNCQPKRGPDTEGTCSPHGDYLLVLKNQVDSTLAQGYVMAIMVDGVGLVCLLSDVRTWNVNPGDYVFSGTYVEGGDTHFPLYSCQTPFGDQTVPFYKFYVHKGTTVTPTAKEEPGCKPTPSKAALQTELTVRAHGLLWGGHHYGSVQVFGRVLAREGNTWRGWKKNHPDLARGLVEHNAAYKRHRK